MKKLIIILSVLFGVMLNGYSKDFTKYQLSNGLTVYLWEDHNYPGVSGMVAVRAGSLDEPLEYTGLAHYLEHVLFKGTERIGAFDWEKEKVHYESIVKLYDERAATTDPAKRDEIDKKINEESIAASKYSFTNEFSNLIQGMGGEGLNAGTWYDYTVYYNDFPTFQIEKWLDLNSERFINPVFRAFQAELENVFEEYNWYQDNLSTHTSNFLFSNLFKGHPYERDVIGTPEHLKNPQLSKLIEFFNTWYVPNNMALILVGDFETEKVVPMIDAKFSRLQAKPLPERPTYPETDFSGNPTVTAKIGYAPNILWGYPAVVVGHEDERLLDFTISLLSNSMSTGLLDKLTLDGDVQYAGASLFPLRDRGRVIINAVPYYDSSQRRYDSNKATEKLVMQEVDKLKKGEIEDWLIESVKNSQLREYELMLESAGGKSDLLQRLFLYQLSDDYFESTITKLLAVTKADIQRVANKYLTGNHLTISIEQGTPKKNKLKKPDIKPVDQVVEQTSEYAGYLKAMPVQELGSVYNDFSEVKSIDLYKDIHLHYTENPVNDYFTLTLKYGVGTEKMPKLEYATSLMNSAGIMPSSNAQEVRRQFSELNATCTFRVSNDYFYINIIGSEDKLEEICKLMTRQTLMPKLDDKQLNRVVGSEISGRLFVEKKNADVLGAALRNYALYKDKSDYIDRMGLMDVYYLKISELTGEIIRATNYELDIHYVGKKPYTEVSELLKANLPLKEGVRKSESPFVKDRVSYDKPTIYFLPNSESQQAQIYFYFDGAPYTIADEVYYRAFQEYFSGSFNGLVMQEIREKNSMAYSAGGYFATPPIPNKNAYFMGALRTQPDKAADAIDIFVKLLNDMPQYPDRIDNIRTYLKQGYLSAKPSFRYKSQIFEMWKKEGYTDDPAKTNEVKIDNLSFDDIVSFYNKNVKGKPLTIIIMGDAKLINQKQIQEKHGKITKVSANTLFSKE